MTNNSSDQKKLEKVLEALNKVPLEMKQMIFDLAQNMTLMEIINSFNQYALDLFTALIIVTKKMKQEKEYKIDGYKTLFEAALKKDIKLPANRFTLDILLYAPEIYAENEDCFLSMTIPDANVSVNNEFGIIRSQKFKELWKIISNTDRKTIKANIISLTMFAHVFLYKTIT